MVKSDRSFSSSSWANKQNWYAIGQAQFEEISLATGGVCLNNQFTRLQRMMRCTRSQLLIHALIIVMGKPHLVLCPAGACGEI